MANYLVTGGAGFIGSYLVDYLINKGHQVTVFDCLVSGKKSNINKHAHFIFGSITDKGLLERAFEGADFCYHLAAIPSVQESIQNWSECHKVNLGGTINIFEAAAKRKIPVIYASSAAVYGGSLNIPLKEDSQIIPASPYGLDKYFAEAHAKLFASLRGLKSVGLRFFNVYGSRQDPSSSYSGVISIFIRKILDNRKVQIFGDGNQVRDFIYVNDVVQALIKANEKEILEANSSFNVCTGQGTSINLLIEILGELLNRKIEVEYLPVSSGDIYKSIGDPMKLDKFINYRATTGIKEGLRYLLSDIQL